VADADIFITPDEYIVPMTCAFPAIGLKDGPISKEKEASSAGTTLAWDVRYHVSVIIYVDMTAGETPIVGQTTPSIKGILDIAQDINTILHENYLSISGILDACCIGEAESEIIGFSDIQILKKRLIYEYMVLPSL
jgi:hypothetical protein